MKIKLIRLDAADEIAGLKYGQVFEAALKQNGAAIFFAVELADGSVYFLRNEQVVAHD